MGNDAVGLRLDRHRPRALGLQERTQLRSEVKGPPLTVLRRARLQADRRRPEIDLSPRQPQDFRDPPARDVGEQGHRPHRLRQMPAHGVELVSLEEPLSSVALAEHRDIRPAQDFAPLHGERQSPLQRGQLAVDRCVTDTVCLALSHVVANAGGVERLRSPVPEGAPKVGDRDPGAPQRLPPIRRVLRDEVAQQRSDPDAVRADGDRLASSDRAQPFV